MPLGREVTDSTDVKQRMDGVSLISKVQGVQIASLLTGEGHNIRHSHVQKV